MPAPIPTHPQRTPADPYEEGIDDELTGEFIPPHEDIAPTAARPKISMPCPTCGAELVARNNRMTGHEFLGCVTWPACSHTQPLPEYVRLVRIGAPQLSGFEGL